VSRCVARVASTAWRQVPVTVVDWLLPLHSYHAVQEASLRCGLHRLSTPAAASPGTCKTKMHGFTTISKVATVFLVASQRPFERLFCPQGGSGDASSSSIMTQIKLEKCRTESVELGLQARKKQVG
jgi:hypothetical protein